MKTSSRRLNAEEVIAESADFPPKDAVISRTDMSNITLWMLGHAHIDLGYRWDFQETIHRIAPWTFRGVLRMIEQHRGFVFAQSQLYLYHAMELHYPEIFLQIRKAISDGQWDVVGGAWSEYDTCLCGGESLVRQHLHGMRYAQDTLGVDGMNVAFVPDSFIRHPRTLPQILAGCGFRYYLFGRGLPQDPEHPERRRRAFRWRGPDGSELIAYLPFGPYSNPPLTLEYLPRLSPYAAAAVSNHELALFGTGDHGGGPREPDFEALEALPGVPMAPNTRFGKLTEYFEAAFTDEVVQNLDLYELSLKAFATGSLTSQAQMKRGNRLLERRLIESEALCVIATTLQRKPSFPRVDYQDLWRILLTHQFHDVLPGTSVASVYRAVEADYRRMRKHISELNRDSYDRIASRIDTDDLPGEPFVIVNPALRPWDGVVRIRLPKHVRRVVNRRCVVRDAAGHDIDAGFDGKEVVFETGLPSLGYRTYTIVTDDHAASPKRRTGGDWFKFDGRLVTTDLHRAEFCSKTGDLLQVEDLGDGSPLLASPSNTLELWQEYERATSWVELLESKREDLIMTRAPRIKSLDRYAATIETESRAGCSVFRRRVTFYRSSRRIDFRIILDWREQGSFLKLGFTPAGRFDSITTSLPFGFEQVDDPAAEFPTGSWISCGYPDRSVVILTDGSHGADVEEGRLRLSLIRNARDMDPAMSIGKHELRYAIFAVPRSLDQAGIMAEHARFISRIGYAFTGHHKGGLKTWGQIDTSNSIPREGSFLSIDNPAVEIEAFKMPDEAFTPDGFVVRLRELGGSPQRFMVTLPYEATEIVATDHLERPTDAGTGHGNYELTGRTVKGSIRPYEIKTFIAYL